LKRDDLRGKTKNSRGADRRLANRLMPPSESLRLAASSWSMGSNW
jgi:hypothetical protein